MTLRPEDWLLAKDVFEGARALPADARQSYVAAACGANEVSRHEVELLLSSHERANSFPGKAYGDSDRARSVLRNVRGVRSGRGMGRASDRRAVSAARRDPGAVPPTHSQVARPSETDESAGVKLDEGVFSALGRNLASE